MTQKPYYGEQIFIGKSVYCFNCWGYRASNGISEADNVLCDRTEIGDGPDVFFYPVLAEVD